MASTSARKCLALRSRAFEDCRSGEGGHGILHLLDKSKDVGEKRGEECCSGYWSSESYQCEDVEILTR